MYPAQVPKQAVPDVRVALVERAAELLARREPVTVRRLAQAADTSTMAVYTHFGGMPGLWRAVRQEGFTRLSRRLAAVERTRDPVRDLVALAAAYVENALANPDLYRTMFDAGLDLEDPEAAAATFAMLVTCAEEARDTGRFDRRTDPEALATRFWASGHGLVSLVLTGVLSPQALIDHVPPVATALFVSAGAVEKRCRRSVRDGWQAFAASQASK